MSPLSQRPNSPWIALHWPRACARLRLFCLPFAGGGASSYRTWSSQLPAHIEVAPVQLPGREGRLAEDPLRRMDDLVEALIEALLPWMQELPFAFFGHSLGAIVALEAARAVARRQAPLPAHVILGARPAPHLRLRRAPVAGLSRESLKQWLREVNGTPEAVLQNREIMDLILPVLRADLDMDDNYSSSADPPLACPLTVLGGMRDQEATPEELEPWSAYTSNRFTLRLLDGDHFFPFNQAQSPALAAVADALTGGDTIPA
jgi:medium-chain acyl-[acyl-carrier-protein] hydrolase